MRELFPILLTLCILVAGFGIWYSARNNGWFVNETAEDFNLCRTSPDTVCIRWEYPQYGIRGFSKYHYNNDILHLTFDLSKNSFRDQIVLHIDTMNIHYIRIYGKTFPVKDIEVCK